MIYSLKTSIENSFFTLMHARCTVCKNNDKNEKVHVKKSSSDLVNQQPCYRMHLFFLASSPVLFKPQFSIHGSFKYGVLLSGNQYCVYENACVWLVWDMG